VNATPCDCGWLTCPGCDPSVVYPACSYCQGAECDGGCAEERAHWAAQGWCDACGFGAMELCAACEAAAREERVEPEYAMEVR
jgi:hypothetical protein